MVKSQSDCGDEPQCGAVEAVGLFFSGLNDVQVAEVLLLSTTNFKYRQLLW